MADSRYTLLILSPAFLADVWAAYANTLSSHLSVNQQRPRLIPLIYAACDLSLGIDALKKLDCTTPQGYTASLADLRALLSQPLDAPPAPPSQAGPSHTGVGDASAFIHEKTRGLVGRDWVCTAVQAFVQDPQRSSGYFVLSGEPGIGKSSIAAELVRRFGWVHHVNRRTAGIVTCATAWRNLASPAGSGSFSKPRPSAFPSRRPGTPSMATVAPGSAWTSSASTVWSRRAYGA